MGLLVVAVLHWVCFAILVYQHHMPAPGSWEYSSENLWLFATAVLNAFSHLS